MSAEPATGYEQTTAFEWTERAFELLAEGRLQAEIHRLLPGVLSAHVWGQCPRCRHQLDDWQALSAVTGSVTSRRPGSDPLDDVTVVDIDCGCGTVHAGAPGGTTGCGVSFRVELEADDGKQV